MKKKLSAFTLGEVLIALTVIGVVATMVLPSVIRGQKSSKARSAFNTAYSIVSSTVATMDSNNISLKPVTYIDTPSNFYTEIKKYMKVNYDCGSSSLCDPKPSYSDIDNNGAFVLNNGMLFVVEKLPIAAAASTPEEGESGGTPASGEEDSETTENQLDSALFITVDINGNSKVPNRRGVDVFSFELIDNDIVPAGAPDSSLKNEACSNVPGAQKKAAMACTQAAATDDDYFKKLYNNL